MRSILLEASSIERAIDKAWNEAGKPREFTIKVHDEGEKNFFGFSRRPARLSILYVPQRDENSLRNSRSRSSRNNSERRMSDRRPQNDSCRSNDRNDRNDRNERSDRRSSSSRSSAPRDRDTDTRSSSPSHSNDWRGEWEKYVITTVRDIVKLMGITVPFEAKRDDKMLTLTFKKALLQDPEEQHMLFASLSYLSIQFLKRHYKNRFLGYRVLISCAEKNEANASRTEESAAKPEQARSERSSSRRRSSAPRQTETADAVEEAVEQMQTKDEEVETSTRRRSSGSRTDKKRAAGPVGDDIASEQIRFAQQQLAREQKETGRTESASVETAPVEAAPAPAPVEKAVEAVPAAEKAEPKKADSKKAEKAKSKLQRFYVLPEEDSESGNNN